MFKQPVQDAGLTGRPSYTRKEQGTLVQKIQDKQQTRPKW